MDRPGRAVLPLLDGVASMSLLKLRSGFEWLLEVITMFLVVALTVVVLLGVLSLIHI